MDIPMQPTVNQRPWFVMGLMLAVVILVMAGYAYFLEIMEREITHQHKQTVQLKKH
jgi:type VI protein secretion system component VasF